MEYMTKKEASKKWCPLLDARCTTTVCMAWSEIKDKDRQANWYPDHIQELPAGRCLAWK